MQRDVSAQLVTSFDPNSAPLIETSFDRALMQWSSLDQATQAELEARIARAGFVEPDTYVLDHGYCRSVYLKDPNGMILEFTYDTPDAAAGDATRRATAHAELARWLAGDRKNNNPYRHAA